MDSGKFPIKGDSGGGHIPFWTGTYGSVEKSLDVSNSRMVAMRSGRFEWVLSGPRETEQVTREYLRRRELFGTLS